MPNAAPKQLDFATEELLPQESVTFAEQGFWCPSCRDTRATRPSSGNCPKCPAEPVYDLSNLQQRQTAIELVEEMRVAKQRSLYQRASAIAFILAFVIIGVHLLLFFMFFDEIDRAVGRGAGRLALPVEAAVVFPLIPRIARWLAKSEIRSAKVPANA